MVPALVNGGRRMATVKIGRHYSLPESSPSAIRHPPLTNSFSASFLLHFFHANPFL
jgi:hypothetical protein